MARKRPGASLHGKNIVARGKYKNEGINTSDAGAILPRRGRNGRARLDHDAYRMLADFRYLIRRFLAFSQDAARRGGLSPRHHQALLAIKGFPGKDAPTIGDLAERLCIRHHSAVELADRLVEAGLIERRHDPHDRRRVFLPLTAEGERQLGGLSAAHFEELHRLRPALLSILDSIGPPEDEL
ncbi:MAG TPA: MarR family transcriptional regulator [Stellaceae bacterium]